MTPLSQILRVLFGVTPSPGAFTRSVACPSVDGLGEVRICRGLMRALRAALEISGAGNGVLLVSDMPAEVLVTLLLLAESPAATTQRDPLAGVHGAYLDAAAGRLVHLPIWLDSAPPLTSPELAARIRRLAAEWETFTDDGTCLRRLALVVVDDQPRVLGAEDQPRERLMAIATELGVAVTIVREVKQVP